MRRNTIKYLAFIIMSLILSVKLYACLPNENCTGTLTYSNLAGEASSAEVRQALEEAGFSQRVVGDFFNQVNHFNKLIENTSLKDDFTKIYSPKASYEQEKILKLITKNEPSYLGHNCRLTSYTLMREFVELEKAIPPDTNYPAVDVKVLEMYKDLYTQHEINTYKVLFSEIDTERTDDISVHVKKYKKHIAERGIEFKNPEKASLIFVVFHEMKDDSSKLVVGHAGVLLHQKGVGYLFIEKLNFEEPYQAIKLKNKACLNNYLMMKYDVEREEGKAGPFILENGELLEGFQSSPLGGSEIN